MIDALNDPWQQPYALCLMFSIHSPYLCDKRSLLSLPIQPFRLWSGPHIWVVPMYISGLYIQRCAPWFSKKLLCGWCMRTCWKVALKLLVILPSTPAGSRQLCQSFLMHSILILLLCSMFNSMLIHSIHFDPPWSCVTHQSFPSYFSSYLFLIWEQLPVFE